MRWMCNRIEDLIEMEHEQDLEWNGNDIRTITPDDAPGTVAAVFHFLV